MATENDLVLVHYEGQPLFFARIEDISPDMKKDWYHVKLLILQIPLQTVTWILREAYINGEEFTMGGNRMRLEKVEAPADQEQEPEQMKEEKDQEEKAGQDQASDTDRKGTVISFDKLKPKKQD